MYTVRLELQDHAVSDRAAQFWQRALNEPTSEAREAAAWELFVAVEPGLTRLPTHKAHELPVEARPLLIAASECARGISPLDSLARLSLSSDEEVRKAVARALVRMSLGNGAWDRSRAREILEGLRTCGSKKFKHFIQDSYDELAPKNLDLAVLRLKSSEPDETVWSGVVGAAALLLMGATILGVGVSIQNSTVCMIGLVFVIRILWVLWRPGEKGKARDAARRLALLKQIEEYGDDDPEALRRALPELRVLSWRISDEPDEVRVAAARLVRRIQATERDASQLPLAAHPPEPSSRSLPVPSADGNQLEGATAD